MIIFIPQRVACQRLPSLHDDIEEIDSICKSGLIPLHNLVRFWLHVRLLIWLDLPAHTLELILRRSNELSS